jgi:hypothetical protein
MAFIVQGRTNEPGSGSVTLSKDTRGEIFVSTPPDDGKDPAAVSLGRKGS